MSTTIYATATLHINKHPYRVLAPPHVQPMHPAVMNGTFFAPIYEAFDHQVNQLMAVPIAKMVEMLVSKTGFTILEDRDVVAILHQIDCYIEEVFPMRRDSEVAAYLEKILKLREKIYMLFRRVLNLHPDWKEAYVGNVGILGAMGDLYRSFGVNMRMPITQMEDLAISPTIRANPDAFKLGNRADTKTPTAVSPMGYDV